MASYTVVRIAWLLAYKITFTASSLPSKDAGYLKSRKVDTFLNHKMKTKSFKFFKNQGIFKKKTAKVNKNLLGFVCICLI